MRQRHVSSGSKNEHPSPESETNLAAIIAVISLIILLVCVFR